MGEGYGRVAEPEITVDCIFYHNERCLYKWMMFENKRCEVLDGCVCPMTEFKLNDSYDEYFDL